MPCHLWTVIRRDGSGRHAYEQAIELVSTRALRFKLATLKDWSFARASRVRVGFVQHEACGHQKWQ